ncbi:hypothetical protein CLV51_102266 [Chitinophaga niastensis]|uniref:Uncharacterized protein n=1 Tax=Chitinophaga niastensis TaxID=536980 RepID=A0A2P8HMI2_CHINA|nr:hypothetical protein [Chitinophaga niastensis]PSL47419.1 hypothetical protein CLV51_102266 [Chitinophaga niastensis]
MDRRQLNTLGMYQAVLTHLDKFPTTWQQLEPVIPIVDSFRINVNALLLQSQLQEQNNTVGHTLNKDQHLNKLREAVYQLSLKLRAYAKTAKNNVMLQDVNFPYSTLENTTEQLMLQRCTRIIQHAKETLPALKGYSVTEQDITDIEKLVADAHPLSAQRNVIAGTRKTATDTIPEIIQAAREQLDVLDDLMECLVTDDTFSETYFNLRRINDRVGRGSAKMQKEV